MKYKVAVAQINSGANITENVNKMNAMIREAAQNKADLIAFPETSEYLGTDFMGNAQDVPGKITKFFSQAASEHQIYIHCGSVTRKTAERKPANTSLLFDRTGNIVGSYSKLHMFDVMLEEGPSYRESDEISAGHHIMICDTKIGKIGMAICYDMRFPEIFRLMAKQGAEVICVPANFTTDTGKDHWEVLLRARAIENTCYIIAPGQIGQKPKFRAYGKSLVIDPWGNIIAKASDREQLIYADIDLDYIREIRAQVPSLYNIREDVYQLTSSHVKVFQEEKE